MLATQTVMDAGDPINLGANATLLNNILVHEILGDQVITNTVPGAPLSGTEPLIAAMGLTSYSQSAFDPMGIDGAVRFTEGEHGSILSPASSPAATAEMQQQMAAFHLSGGTAVNIADDSVVQ
ncbi:MAG: hypothetical protein R3E90_03165 [Marinicella sp.]